MVKLCFQLLYFLKVIDKFRFCRIAFQIEYILRFIFQTLQLHKAGECCHGFLKFINYYWCRFYQPYLPAFFCLCTAEKSNCFIHGFLLLAKVELFANVAPRRLKLLALASSRVLFAAGQDLCVEGDEGYEAFILVSGEADVKIRTPSGVATVARLKRNDIVGEMAILLVTRHWTSHFEWNAHKRAALAAGLDPTIVAAIAVGERPASLQPNENVLYRFCIELLETKRVGDETFAATKAAFGEQGVVDVIYTLGYYSMVAMLLNVDDHPLPAGVAPELQPLD